MKKIVSICVFIFVLTFICLAYLSYKPANILDFWVALNWCISGAILSALVTLLLIQFFRPQIEIGTPVIETDKKGKDVLKIPVSNILKTFDAINVQAEVAFIERQCSYHLKLDKFEFLILPNSSHRDNTRVFQTNQLEDFTVEIIGGTLGLANITDIINTSVTRLRVRVYAQHQFTGFGKSFEKLSVKNNNTYYEI